MWNDTFLPLFKCKAGKFVQTIKFADQLPRKKFVMTEETIIDPVCLIHGKRQSENPPHWAGRCFFCCLCFKELKSTDECMSTPDGNYEDVCKECGANEKNKNMEISS